MATVGRLRLDARPVVVLARTAAMFTLLAGVLAMHALAAGHDATISSSSPVPTTAEAHSAAPVTVFEPSHQVTMPSVDVAMAPAGPTAGMAAVHACVSCEGQHAPSSGAHLLDVCLAVLSGASALFLLFMRARDHLSARFVDGGVRVAFRPMLEALRPRPLFILCVLRT